jgi:hypothetical protein
VLGAWALVSLRLERWAVRMPDDDHTYGIRVRGGADLFFTQPLGWFLDHALLIFVVLSLITLAAEWLTQRGQAPQM